MAKYTMELNEVIENHNIFDFEYNLPDNSKKEVLQDMFIRKYFFNEIAYETIEQFKYQLQTMWKFEIMNYYPVWKNLKEFEIYVDNKGTSSGKVYFEDAPNTGATGIPTTVTHSENESKVSNKSDFEQFYAFKRIQHNVDIDFIEQFRGLFLKIY